MTNSNVIPILIITATRNNDLDEARSDGEDDQPVPINRTKISGDLLGPNWENRNEPHTKEGETSGLIPNGYTIIQFKVGTIIVSSIKVGHKSPSMAIASRCPSKRCEAVDVDYLTKFHIYWRFWSMLPWITIALNPTALPQGEPLNRNMRRLAPSISNWLFLGASSSYCTADLLYNPPASYLRSVQIARGLYSTGHQQYKDDSGVTTHLLNVKRECSNLE